MMMTMMMIMQGATEFSYFFLYFVQTSETSERKQEIFQHLSVEI